MYSFLSVNHNSIKWFLKTSLFMDIKIWILYNLHVTEYYSTFNVFQTLKSLKTILSLKAVQNTGRSGSGQWFATLLIKEAFLKLKNPNSYFQKSPKNWTSDTHFYFLRKLHIYYTIAFLFQKEKRIEYAIRYWVKFFERCKEE